MWYDADGRQVCGRTSAQDLALEQLSLSEHGRESRTRERRPLHTARRKEHGPSTAATKVSANDDSHAQFCPWVYTARRVCAPSFIHGCMLEGESAYPDSLTDAYCQASRFRVASAPQTNEPRSVASWKVHVHRETPLRDPRSRTNDRQYRSRCRIQCECKHEQRNTRGTLRTIRECKTQDLLLTSLSLLLRADHALFQRPAPSLS
jgi:hypothetical protein